MSARLPELIALLALAGCRGESANQSSERTAGSAAGSSASGGARPTLPETAARTPEERAAMEHALAGPERVFTSEPVDAEWAKATMATIKSAAPWAQVECRTRQCRVTILAPSAEDAIAKTDALRALKNDETEDALAQWMPVPPITRGDGSLEVRVYAVFDRR